jgi:HAD domain in Swiss Army Knife RNA repair proteins
VTLFLDFDNVLHPGEVYRVPGRGVVLRGPGQLFEHASALEMALEPFVDVRIVLSTSWVPALGYSRARKHLPTRLAARVVGATYHSRHTPDWHRQTRYQQIHDHVRRHGLGTRWVALEDDVEGWPDSEYDRLIVPSGPRGLQSADFELLKQRLRSLKGQR